jgi:hypothetical protein
MATVFLIWCWRCGSHVTDVSDKLAAFILLLHPTAETLEGPVNIEICGLNPHSTHPAMSVSEYLRN